MELIKGVSEGEGEGATLNKTQLGKIHGIRPSNHGACNTERNPLKVLLFLWPYYLNSVSAC